MPSAFSNIASLAPHLRRPCRGPCAPLQRPTTEFPPDTHRPSTGRRSLRSRANTVAQATAAPTPPSLADRLVHPGHPRFTVTKRGPTRPAVRPCSHHGGGYSVVRTTTAGIAHRSVRVLAPRSRFLIFSHFFGPARGRCRRRFRARFGFMDLKKLRASRRMPTPPMNPRSKTRGQSRRRLRVDPASTDASAIR
jgi:hypothetical protein